MMKSY
jgi:hypothetical protein